MAALFIVILLIKVAIDRIIHVIPVAHVIYIIAYNSIQI